MSLLSDLISLNLFDTTEKVIAEYIWVGVSGMDMRSKARTLSGPVNDPSRLPKWNYDGSSTGQAPGEDSEVMCDSYTAAGEPIPTNKRYNAAKILSHPDVKLLYDLQIGMALSRNTPCCRKMSNDLLDGLLVGPYYCGTGANKAFGRDIVDSHCKACLYAGINISGINEEVMPGQWEFQLGPSVGISASDELWVARYILERIIEIVGVVLSIDPQPIKFLLTREIGMVLVPTQISGNRGHLKSLKNGLVINVMSLCFGA
ncbi:Glutamine synthetase cytosolic isozyme 2 [Spatholobus suberectus]|nr:Glutamine synthetase cytosolic isozyme 2 [Spatholobus suberectus]